MHILYVDESGNPDDEPTSSHFVIAGLSLPLHTWKDRDADLRRLFTEHRLAGAEVHSAWMARRYPEQQRIDGFHTLSESSRRDSVIAERKKDLAKAGLRGPKAVRSLNGNYRKTAAYIHLSHDERLAALRAIADLLGGWEDVRLFAEAQMKSELTPTKRRRARGNGLEQVTTRFNTYLDNVHGADALSVIVHDQHQAASTNLTVLFRKWHENGTRYASIPHVTETPLFVDSSLNAMVQVADLVAYATRRFFDKGETDLFDRFYGRYDRTPGGLLVGLRHFTARRDCACRVCEDHGRGR